MNGNRCVIHAVPSSCLKSEILNVLFASVVPEVVLCYFRPK